MTGDESVYVSPITIAEMKFGAEISTVPDIRQRRLAGVAKLMGKAILSIDEGTGEMFGNLAAQLRHSGRGHEFRTQDLWLASQAVQHGLILLTHNEKDFWDIPVCNCLCWRHGDQRVGLNSENSRWCNPLFRYLP